MIRIPRPSNPAAHIAGSVIFLSAAILFLLDGSIMLDAEPLRGAGNLVFGALAAGAAFAAMKEFYLPRR